MKLTVQSPCINHFMQMLCKAKSRSSGKFISEAKQQVKQFPEEFSAQIMHILWCFSLDTCSHTAIPQNKTNWKNVLYSESLLTTQDDCT